MIPLPDCEHRRLYRICSRNLAYGVFSKEAPWLNDFFGLREKFDVLRLDAESHWDYEDPRGPKGTALPLEALPELLPETIALNYKDDALFAWLQEMEAKYGAPGSDRGSLHGVWPMGHEL